jgi:predicted permease
MRAMNLRLLHRIAALFRRDTLDRELNEEISAHLALAIEENLAAGMSPQEARRRAFIAFGGPQQAKENHRDSRSLPMIEIFLQDLRYAFRVFRKNPGFVAVAVLTLALGIGANTALFSVVNGVLLNPMPYTQPERLVAVYAKNSDFGRSSISYPNFLDWVKDNRSFASLAAFRADSFNLTGVGEPQRLSANMVSAAFFPTLGVKPVLGRFFFEQEDALGGAPVAVITESLWKQKFAASPDILGKPMNLDGNLRTIVGVVPSAFRYENNNFNTDAQVYVPIGQWNDSFFRDRRAAMGMDAVGRLKPGVTLDQAQQDMVALAARLAEMYPESNKGSSVALLSLKENVVGSIRPFLLMLLASVGFVLLIACANVANLLLARSTGRTREFAVRSALGADTNRIVRQLLTESVLLAFTGGVLGIVLSAWGTQAALKLLPDALPRADEIHIDGRVLLFTLAASLLAGILFGLVPAFKTSRTAIQSSLKEGGRGGSARHRTQSVFVAVELAFAVVLLIGAGLMIRSLSNLWRVDPGFDPHNVLTFNLATAKPLGTTPDGTRAAFRQLRDVIAAVPGVESVSLNSGSAPMEGDSELPLWLDREPKPANTADMKTTLFYLAQPGYLDVMKIPLKRGRFLQASDNEHSSPVIVIDEKFAKLFFGGDDPIGRHVNFDLINLSAEVVGIVGHVKQWGLDSDSAQSTQGQTYLALEQLPDSTLPLFDRGTSVVIRTANAQAGSLNPIRQAVHTVNGELVLYGSRTMSEIIARSLAEKRFAMSLLGIFAVLALILSSLGIYGVISYVVGQRTQEIGIRMALGAQSSSVSLMVLSQAGKMALLGVGAGLFASLGLGRLISTMLFGVNSHDPLTFVGVAILLLVIALAACYIPARRASRVDPIIALRYE